MKHAGLEEHAIALSLQRALLGAVTANLRAVSFKLHDSTIHVDFIYDGDPAPEDVESAQIAVSEVISDFPHANAIECLRRVDAPAAVPVLGGRLVFARKEPLRP